METAYKMMRADAVRSLRLESLRFEIEPELTAKLLRTGHHIVEVPIGYAPRTPLEGKRIGIRDGVAAIWTLIRWRIASVHGIREDD